MANPLTESAESDTVSHFKETFTEIGHLDASHTQEATGLPQLDTSWMASQLFWLVLTFVFLYVVLSRFSIPRIREALENREARIGYDLDYARQLQKEAEAARATYEASLEDAQQKAVNLINSVQNEIDGLNTNRHQTLDAELTQQMLKADVRIADSVKKAQLQLRPVITELCSEIVSIVLNVSVDTDTTEKAIKKVDAA